jgi:hypothetical protein
MNNEQLKILFDGKFKFAIGEDVRHRGDTKGGYADMGLLVLERHLIEVVNDNNESAFERCYVCRMVRFSGSGDMARFKEKELMTIKEYEMLKEERDTDSNQRRTDARKVEQEVMELFGISKEDYLYEVVDGKPNTSMRFRMTGFSIGKFADSEVEGIAIRVTESLFTAANRSGEGKEVKTEKRQWWSKSQFVKANQ